jgi:hypothetical protein
MKNQQSVDTLEIFRHGRLFVFQLFATKNERRFGSLQHIDSAAVRSRIGVWNAPLSVLWNTCCASSRGGSQRKKSGDEVIPLPCEQLGFARKRRGFYRLTRYCPQIDPALVLSAVTAGYARFRLPNYRTTLAWRKNRTVRWCSARFPCSGGSLLIFRPRGQNGDVCTTATRSHMYVS